MVQIAAIWRGDGEKEREGEGVTAEREGETYMSQKKRENTKGRQRKKRDGGGNNMSYPSSRAVVSPLFY